MDKELIFNKIEAYLNDALSPDDKKAFEAEIARDEVLATAVAMHRLEHEAMERILENELREEMKTWQGYTPFMAIKVEKPLEKPVQKPRFSKRLLVGIFGLLGLGVGAYIYLMLSNLTMRMPPNEHPNTPIKYDTNGVQLNPQVIDSAKTPIVLQETTPSVLKPQKPIIKDNNVPSPKKEEVIVQNTPNQTTETTDNTYTALAEEVYEEPSLGALRGSNAATLLSEASDVFYDKNYQKAIDLLKNVSSTDTQYAQSLVIMGHSYFKLKQYKKAMPVFQELIKIGKPYSEAAEWYVVLCYLTDYSKNKNGIDSGLTAILNNPLHPFYNQARALRDKLK